MAAEFLSRLADVEVRGLVIPDLGFAVSADNGESCSGIEVLAPPVACTPAGRGSLDGFGCAPEFRRNCFCRFSPLRSPVDVVLCRRKFPSLVEPEAIEPLDDEEPNESVDDDPPGPASAIAGLLAISMPSPSEIANALSRPK
jgi:hypothetical protein